MSFLNDSKDFAKIIAVFQPSEKITTLNFQQLVEYQLLRFPMKINYRMLQFTPDLQ